MSIIVNCINCETEFLVSPSRMKVKGAGICCSRDCAAEHRKSLTELNVECTVCGGMFHSKKSHIAGIKHKDKMTCSRVCSNQIRSSFLMSGKNNHQYGLKGGLNKTSKEGMGISELGYLFATDHNHPNSNASDKVLFHRLVMEEYLKSIGEHEYLETIDGRLVLSRRFVVHHKDENKLNNTISNLEVMTLSEHTSMHNLESPTQRCEHTGRFMTGKILSGKLKRTNRTDAGQDVYSSQESIVPARGSSVIDTGLIIAVPDGSVGLLWSRSGLSIKHKVEVGAGCIDAGYRGEVKVHLHNYSDNDYKVSIGDRIAQLVTLKVDLNDYVEAEADELCQTERGESGFGDSGVK